MTGSQKVQSPLLGGTIQSICSDVMFWRNKPRANIKCWRLRLSSFLRTTLASRCICSIQSPVVMSSPQTSQKHNPRASDWRHRLPRAQSSPPPSSSSRENSREATSMTEMRINHLLLSSILDPLLLLKRLQSSRRIVLPTPPRWRRRFSPQ